ncbi:DUF4942 domain-containing protein [Ruminococcus sp.]|uniref:DUF4942 domain-containing protein n=1 Tax=Ruminococcus sp. TaxID=41978 RepID=UPI00386F6F8C
MLEIVYRIYEVADEETATANLKKDSEFGLYNSISKAQNTELVMDCLICESREHFKEIIKAEYGDNISFRYSKRLKAGDLYCIIIGEHCYNTEKYFNKVTFTCDCCNAKVETYFGKPIAFSEYEVKQELFNISEYSKKRFCSYHCKSEYLKKERLTLNPDDDSEFYIDKDMFINKDICFFQDGIHIVGDNFLNFDTFKRYDLVIMNPPFSEGDKHLLKAISLLHNGGQIVCLLNAQTLLNPCTNSRKLLLNLLDEYNADIEYIEGGFLSAERSTDVEVALVYVSIPHKDSFGSDILEHLKEAEKLSESEYAATDLTLNDYIKSSVHRFNLDVELGIRLIEEYNSLAPYLDGSFDKANNSYAQPLLSLSIPDGDLSINGYVESVRRKYWTALLNNESITKNFTSELRSHYLDMVSTFANYDFSEYNIKTLICEMNSKIYQGVEKSIMDLFDKFTEEHSYYPECKNTIHYFNGWKTNKAHKIGKKVIIPMTTYTFYGSLESYCIAHMLSDVEKVFNYFEGNEITSGNIMGILERNVKMGVTRKIELKYFYISIFKKGTVHIEFKDQKLVDRFNIYACQHKNWLPPTYGKIHYDDMTDEEKEVIDSFQGKKEYEKVVCEKDYYLRPVVPENVLSLASGM